MAGTCYGASATNERDSAGGFTVTRLLVNVYRVPALGGVEKSLSGLRSGFAPNLKSQAALDAGPLGTEPESTWRLKLSGAPAEVART